MAVSAYRIVTGNAAHDVTEEVNNLLKGGWALHGDLKVEAGVFSQAMVQEEHYGGIDYEVSLSGEELEGVKYALKDIAESIETVASALAGVAAGLSDKGEE